VEEAAKMELSVARHHYVLRRLVLRYFKALLLLVVTALASFAMTIWLEGSTYTTTKFLPLVLSLWALAASLAVRAPVHWVYSYSAETGSGRHEFTVDKQIAAFETFALVLAPAVAVAASVASFLTESSAPSLRTACALVAFVTLTHCAWVVFDRRLDRSP
jgi:hypothetical protein